MPKRFVCIVALMCAWDLSVHAQATGNTWRDLADRDKSSYAAGVLAGILVGGYLFSLEPDVAPNDAARVLVVLTKKAGGISADQLRDGLNTLFDDFRNRRIALNLGAYVVICQISGMPDIEVSALIERLRL